MNICLLNAVLIFKPNFRKCARSSLQSFFKIRIIILFLRFIRQTDQNTGTEFLSQTQIL